MCLVLVAEVTNDSNLNLAKPLTNFLIILTKFLTIKLLGGCYTPHTPPIATSLAKRRKLERKMLRSGFPNDKERFYNIRNKYSALLRETKIKYYSDLVNECAGNSKKLFRVIKSLSKQESPKNLPPYDDPFILANEFGSFFCRKIELIT